MIPRKEEVQLSVHDRLGGGLELLASVQGDPTIMKPLNPASSKRLVSG